jgi:hypothetical protein
LKVQPKPPRRTGRPLLPLSVRFDEGVMRPPPAVSHAARRHFEQELGERLRRWCDSHAGDGRSPFFQPRVLPEMARPLAVAALVGGPAESIAAAVAAFALELDGTDRMDRIGFARSLLLRAGVKVADCCWWRRRRHDDPWDSGYLRHDPAAVARLDAFLPRRATFLVAQDMAAPTLRKAVVTLRHRQALYAHPVRLLVLGPSLAAGLEPLDIIEPPGSAA